MTLASMLGYLQQHLGKLAKSLLLIAILLLIVGCSSQSDSPAISEPSSKPLFAQRPKIKQIEPPKLIQELDSWLNQYAPQVEIHHPKPDQILDTTTVDIDLRVHDLPIYKDENWEMGPHLELLLDNQPYGSLYDIEQPISLKNLTPGTHTLRVWAERPWHESFKNEGAYDQVTFHVFAKTDENTPVTGQPLLTYGAPMGTYGAEPVLLDFYLTDAPLHLVAQENPNLKDWQIRYTINGDSLTIKEWQPLYIEGLKPGQNWIQLTLVDDQGNPIEGVFNNTVRLINYEPDLNDSLTQIVRGDLTLEQVGNIIDPTYEPPVPEIPEVLAESEDLSQEEETEVSEPPSSPIEVETSEPAATEKPTTIIPEQSVDDGETEPSEIEPAEVTEPSDNANTLSAQDRQDDEQNSSPTATAADDFDAVDNVEPEAEQDSTPLSNETVDPSAVPVTETTDSPLVTATPHQTTESMEESIPDIELEPSSDNSSEDTVSEDAVSKDAVSEDASSEDAVSEDASSETSSDGTPSSTRQYLRRLYDYSDRANRDRIP